MTLVLPILAQWNSYTLIAVVAALFSMVLPSVEQNIVAKNFKRLELSVENKNKPFLKSLIKMKAKNTKFDLEQIYNMNRGMFTKEKLLLWKQLILGQL